MSEWYYQVAGEAVGPVSLEELTQKASDGAIGPEGLVREGPEGEWTQASAVPAISDVLAGSVVVAPPHADADAALTMDPSAEGDEELTDSGTMRARKSPLALHPCLDCGSMVSRQARACPHCGRLFHESSMMLSYQGEHPVPVLVFFLFLSVAFILVSPFAVYFAAMSIASRFVEAGSEGGIAVLVTIVYACSMIASAVLGGAVGKPRMAYVTGLFLGLFFGPLGVFAAFAIDKRPQCCHCSSRLDGLARECPFCHARLTWKVEPSWY